MRMITSHRTLHEVAISSISPLHMLALNFASVSNSSGASFWVPKCDAPIWLDGSRKTVDGKTLDEI